MTIKDEWLANHEAKDMNIYQKLHCITAEMQTVAKNLEIATRTDKNGKVTRSYKAVSERDILDSVKPLEAKYRVKSYPHERLIIDSGFLENTDYNGNVKKSFYLRVQVTYRFVNIDNPSEYVETVAYGDGIDTGDKATGKAMTYADKYALMKMYQISTGDDPDQQASEEYSKMIDTDKPMPQNMISYLKNIYTPEQLSFMVERRGYSKLEEVPWSVGSKWIQERPLNVKDDIQSF